MSSSAGGRPSSSGRNQRPVILLTASSGWAIRNFFHTGLAAELASFAEVTVAASDPLYPYFERLLRAGEITSLHRLPSREPRSKRALRQAKKAVLQARHNVQTASMQWRRRASSPASEAFRSALWTTGRALAANWQIRALEAIERHWPVRDQVVLAPLPSLLINCSPFAAADNELQRQLQRRGVTAVAVIPSWDNPSSKGCILEGSDWVFVWGDHQQTEIQTLYPSISSERVVVTGIPQFDAYRQPLPEPFEREAFLSGLGIDPAARVVLYGTGNPRNTPGEPSVVRAIADAVGAGRFGDDVHLLVRCHPADDIGRYMSIASMPCVTVFPPSVERWSSPTAAPGGPSGTTHVLLSWIPPDDETMTLAAMLRHSEVCLNVASTLTLDALATGTPAINIAYDEEPRPFLHSVKRYYYQEHYLPVTQSGAVALVDSDAELIRAIDSALANPKQRHAAERALVQQLCFQPEEGSVRLIAGRTQALLGADPVPANSDQP